MLRVLVVDDQALFREIARSMFDSSGEFEVVAEASDGVNAVDIYPQMRPDLVLMDIQMARMNGIEATRLILKQDPEARVVLISMKADPEYRRIAEEMGALAFIAKRDLTASALREVWQRHTALAA